MVNSRIISYVTGAYNCHEIMIHSGVHLATAERNRSRLGGGFTNCHVMRFFLWA